MNNNDVINQAIEDIEISEMLDRDLDHNWDIKLKEQWSLIREYEQYIDYSEIQKNEWILRQIDIDALWQINWKAQWKEHYSQPSNIINDAWESNWGLEMYTRYVKRKNLVNLF